MIDQTRKTLTKTGRNEDRSERLRIGAVSYLNSKPLIECLEDLCPQADLILDVPSRLADQLASDELDIALIPSVEAFLNQEYQVVSDACVATHGPVLSVKLYSRVHPGDIKGLALDEGSRTSAALSQIMLSERYGVRPQLEQLPLEQTTQNTDADAILLIGDRAMSEPVETFHTVWDLGEEWVRWTGLPFVFAMWVARDGADLGDVSEKLSQARDEGLHSIRRIASDGSQALQIPMATSLEYLTRHLHFTLGKAERAGLRLFQELAAQLDFAGPEPLKFYHRPKRKAELLVR